MEILMSLPRLPSVMQLHSLVLISFMALKDRSTEAVPTGIFKSLNASGNIPV